VGLVAGGLVAVSVWVHDEPPEFIAKWGRGAEGEEKTGKELRGLVDEGWQLRHDVELERGGNADHVVRSPSGRVYVLETMTAPYRSNTEKSLAAMQTTRVRFIATISRSA
jgi:hypothetical protein